MLNNQAAPVAAFTADVTNGLAPLTVQFTDQSTNSPTSWKWEYNTGSGWVQFATENNPSYSFTTACPYDIRLTATNGNSYPLNNHVNKVYSDYEAQYDVTGLISAANPAVNVKSQAIAGKSFDGRIKGVTLVVAYNDSSSTNQTYYWVNHGGDWSSPGNGQTTFNTAGLSSGWFSAESKIRQFSSSDANYTFNGILKTGGGSTPNLDGLNTWDVTNNITAGQQSTLAYSKGSSYKTTLATLKVKYNTKAAPVANFTATPTSGNAPLTVQFTDASTGTVSSYVWDFADGNNSTDQSPSHPYNTAGTYNVNLTVTGPGGSNSNVKSGYIVVSEPLSGAPVANFTENVTSGNAPLTVKFDASSSHNAISYSWDFGDGNTGTGQIVEHTFANAGTFKVNLTVENDNGTSAAGPHIITAVAPSVPDIPEPSSNIEAQDVSYTFASAGSSTNVNFLANNTSVLNLSFIATSDVGDIILVVDLLKGQSSLTSGSPSGNVYQFLDIWVMNSSGANVENLTDATIGFKVAKSWIQSNNINQSSITLNRYSNGVWSQLPTVLVDDDGMYLYFIAQTPGFSPFAITGNPVSVQASPLLLTKTANPMTYKYVGQKITYTYTVTNSGNVPISGIMVTGDKVTVTISSGTLTPGRSVVGTGTYTITQADMDAGSVNNIASATGAFNAQTVTSNQVTAKVKLQEPWAFFSAKPTYGKAPLTVQFTDNSRYKPTHGEWNFGDGTTSTEQNPSHVYKTPGKYTVTLVAKNAGGSDSDTIKNYIVVTKK